MQISILRRLIYITALAFVFSSAILSCKKEDNVTLKKEVSTVTEIRAWWEKHKKEVSGDNNSVAITNSVAQPVLLSANNGAKDGAAFWTSQFENGTPQWNQARTFQIGGATVYEVPFIFPVNMMTYEDNYGFPSPLPAIYRPTSKTYLLIREEAGKANLAEFMSVVVTLDYLDVLGYETRNFPDIHINNVFPVIDRIGDFTGSIKFYDVKGNQRLEEKYGNGTLVQYLEYGETASAFLMNPAPNILPILSVTTYCTTTYVSVSEIGPDGNPIVYGYSYLNCWFMETGGGEGGGLGGGTGGGGDPRRGGGGGANYTPPPPPAITPLPLIPLNGDLCGGYDWTNIQNTAWYARVQKLQCNFAAPGWPTIYMHLYDISVEIPKWGDVMEKGHVSDLLNNAWRIARERVLLGLNSGRIFPNVTAVTPEFKKYFKEALSQQRRGANINFDNEGTRDPKRFPRSEPKYCGMSNN